MSNNISKNFRLFSAHVKYCSNVFLLSNINVFKHLISLVTRQWREGTALKMHQKCPFGHKLTGWAPSAKEVLSDKKFGDIGKTVFFISDIVSLHFKICYIFKRSALHFCLAPSYLLTFFFCYKFTYKFNLMSFLPICSGSRGRGPCGERLLPLQWIQGTQQNLHQHAGGGRTLHAASWKLPAGSHHFPAPPRGWLSYSCLLWDKGWSFVSVQLWFWSETKRANKKLKQYQT